MRGLVDALIESAQEQLETAIYNLKGERYPAAAVWAYQACFTACTALLASKGVYKGGKTPSHGGTIQLVGKWIARENGARLNELLRLRAQGLYPGHPVITAEEAKEAVDFAKEFLEKIFKFME